MSTCTTFSNILTTIQRLDMKATETETFNKNLTYRGV